MKSFRNIIFGVLLLVAGFSASSCQKNDPRQPIEAKLEIAELVEVDAAGGTVEIPLVSTYPWYCDSNASWFTITKKMGQMKLKEKIVLEVEANPSSEARDAQILVRLMDQLEVPVKVVQAGK